MTVSDMWKIIPDARNCLLTIKVGYLENSGKRFLRVCCRGDWVNSVQRIGANEDFMPKNCLDFDIEFIITISDIQ